MIFFWQMISFSTSLSLVSCREKKMFWTNKKFAKTEKKSWKKLVKQVCQKIWWIRFRSINENCYIFQMYSFAIIFDVCCSLSMSNIIKEFVWKKYGKVKIDLLYPAVRQTWDRIITRPNCTYLKKRKNYFQTPVRNKNVKYYIHSLFFPLCDRNLISIFIDDKLHWPSYILRKSFFLRRRLPLPHVKAQFFLKIQWVTKFEICNEKGAYVVE